jgi:hypothetical protein
MERKIKRVDPFVRLCVSEGCLDFNEYMMTRFCGGTFLQGVGAFAKENKKVFEENRLNIDDVTVKTRIMALLVLATKSIDIPYSAVKVGKVPFPTLF